MALSNLSTLADAWAAAGALCLAFVILWGLNYRRPPYAVLAGLDARPATVGELTAACERLIGETNRAIPSQNAG